MKLVIEIPKEEYELRKRIASRHGAMNMVNTAIANGKPLDESFEWCHGCKEYDHEKHCCPRFNKVIRTTLNDSINAVLDEIKAEIEQEIACKPMEMWDFRLGLVKTLGIIDKCKAERGGEE